MLVGVVSDTHNNVKNIKNIINIFNTENVEFVIHTGDITNATSLEMFSNLGCRLIGVYGNNDRNEEGLEIVCQKYNFNFQEPPLSISLNNKKIAIFHEPDSISEYLDVNKNTDLVLHGHTHRYRKEIINDVLHFNPGESSGLIENKNSLGVINLNNLDIKRIFF